VPFVSGHGKQREERYHQHVAQRASGDVIGDAIQGSMKGKRGGDQDYQPTSGERQECPVPVDERPPERSDQLQPTPVS
jgi:hypothetical protein